MNLHGIAVGAVGVVNPNIPVIIKISTGYTTDPDGTRVPTYIEIDEITAQIQALSYTDIQMIDGLQLNGERRAIYLFGKFDSVDRPAGKGGDLIVFPDGTTWKIAQATETWPGWCKVVVTLQVDG